jgi:hypothetical protein
MSKLKKLKWSKQSKRLLSADVTTFANRRAQLLDFGSLDALSGLIEDSRSVPSRSVLDC